MKDFSDFIDQIPPNIYNNTEAYLGNGVILFKPKIYIGEVELHTTDYHIVLPSEPPPPICISQKTIQINKNRLLVLNPDTSIHCTKEVVTREYYALSIKKELLTKIAQEMGLNQEIVFSKIDNPYTNYLKQCIVNLETELKCYDLNCSLMVESIGIQLVVLLLREIKNNINSKLLTQDDTRNYIDLACEYIQTYYNSNITIEDICKEIHITPFHFIRLFKEKMGITPHQYLLYTRIERAKELLQKRECSIAQVAKTSGFISVSHFSSTFKNRIGKSPLSYQKSYFLSVNLTDSNIYKKK